MNGQLESVNQFEITAEKVRQLTFRINKFTDITAITTMTSVLLGEAGWNYYFCYGNFGRSCLCVSKKNMSKEVLDLESKQILSEIEAGILQNQIRKIYGKPPA